VIVKVKANFSIPPGLSNFQVYEVLSLILYKDGRTEVRVPSDGDGLPALYSLLELDIVNGDIPQGWCVVRTESGAVELLPKEWAYPGFWNRFFDGEKEAEEAFNLYFEKSRMK
jgi:hypothetical protein